MGNEHPVNKPIRMIQIPCDEGGNPKEYVVGRYGVTKIEATVKSGMHADIPYVRVWKGDEPVAEFCQHLISGLWWFAESEQPAGPN